MSESRFCGTRLIASAKQDSQSVDYQLNDPAFHFALTQLEAVTYCQREMEKRVRS
jgi:hypothetical protein